MRYAYGLVLLLCMLVMAGWWMDSAFLVQIRPEWVPVQFNTALGFALLAVAGLRGKKWPAWVAAAIAQITLIEYAVHAGPWFDTLFSDHAITVGTSSPGRMAPNTAATVILGAFAVHWGKDRIGLLVCSAAAIIASVAGIGYLAHAPAFYGWGALTAMAPATIAFSLLHTVATFSANPANGTFRRMCFNSTLVSISLISGAYGVLQEEPTIFEVVGSYAIAAAIFLGIVSWTLAKELKRFTDAGMGK